MFRPLVEVTATLQFFVLCFHRNINLSPPSLIITRKRMGRWAAPTLVRQRQVPFQYFLASSCTVGTLPSFAVKSAVAFVAFKDNSF